MTIKSVPARPTERVLMWRLAGPGGKVHFGALGDGTVFQNLPGSGWRTILTGPADFGDAEAFILLTTRAAESQGATVDVPPCEFGIDAAITADIRADRNWARNDFALSVAFDMAKRVGR